MNRRVRLLLLSAVLPLFAQCTAYGAWDLVSRQLSGQVYRLQLRFDNTAQAEDLIDFPVLVVLDVDRVDYGDFENGTGGDGSDIRFVDTDTEQQLAHEIELWNTGGKSYIWVKVPRIDGGVSSDSIHMYYGNPTAGAVQDPGAVWSEYELVYHFSNAVGTTVPDSSPNGNHCGTSYEDATPAAATLVTTGTGQGLRCDSAPAVRRYVDTNYRNDLTTWTVEAWVRADADPILNGVAGQDS